MFASVNGVRLFFDVVGEKLRIGADDALKERATLICLHGGPGGDHQSLRPMFDRFGERAQVIYFDQRGSGRSEHGDPKDWTLAQWADDLKVLCDVLGIEKPIPMGVSGGSIVTLSYLTRHPGHAGAAILINAVARMDQQALIDGFGTLGGPEARAAAEAMYSRGDMAALPGFVRHCMPHYSRRISFGMPTGVSRTGVNFAVSQHFFRTGGEAFGFDFRGRLGAVTCPVLALCGAHDPVTMAVWGREATAELPGGEYVSFDESSHLIMMDEPEKFNAVVDGFLDRVKT